VVNLGLIQKFIEAGKLDAGQPITEDALVASGLVRRKLDGIRVLAKGDFGSKVSIEVTGASKSAVEAVEKAGGSLKVAAQPEAAE
jgi:large subunit ribosomal protein L15